VVSIYGSHAKPFASSRVFRRVSFPQLLLSTTFAKLRLLPPKLTDVRSNVRIQSLDMFLRAPDASRGSLEWAIAVADMDDM
jgi:hypothetical protein